MKAKKIILLVMSLLLMLLVAGCDQTQNNNNDNTKSNVSSTTKPETSKKDTLITEVKVYYADDNALGLHPVMKQVKATDKTKYKAAMEALLTQPEEKNLIGIFPQKAKLLKVSVDKDTAIVDFDSNLVKGFSGGSTGEEMLVGSIVNTLTEFPEIKNVQLLIEGKEVDTISGHMDTSKPLTRMPELIIKK